MPWILLSKLLLLSNLCKIAEGYKIPTQLVPVILLFTSNFLGLLILQIRITVNDLHLRGDNSHLLLMLD
jgi:hypothetical protein